MWRGRLYKMVVVYITSEDRVWNVSNVLYTVFCVVLRRELLIYGCRYVCSDHRVLWCFCVFFLGLYELCYLNSDYVDLSVVYEVF